MSVNEHLLHLRLVVALFAAWTTWQIARAPYQKRTNAILATFLALVALGFSLEYAWNLFADAFLGTWMRQAQMLVGLIDPPILLAYAISVQTVWRRRHAPLWLCYGAIVLALLYPGLEYTRTQNYASRPIAFEWYPHVEAFYVDATYLAAFLILFRALQAETRPYFSRQFHWITLGVGFIAVTRSAFGIASALPTPGWVRWSPPQSLWVVLAAFVLLGALFGFHVLSYRGSAPVVQLYARLAGLLAAFLAVLLVPPFVSFLATGDRGGPLATLTTFFYGFRWIVFSLLVAFGILRYQLFDLNLRVRQAAAALVGISASAIVMVFFGAYWQEQGAEIGPARLAGLAAGLLVAYPVYRVALAAAGPLWPRRDAENDRRRLLEIYEATIESALRRPQGTNEDRRFVDTLRELSQITLPEHEEIVRRVEARRRATAEEAIPGRRTSSSNP